MTDDHLDPRDDLASALLDGVEPADRAGTGAGDGGTVAAGDPDVARRAEAFRAVRAALGAPVPEPADSDRRAAIAAALDAFDQAAGASPTDAAPTTTGADGPGEGPEPGGGGDDLARRRAATAPRVPSRRATGRWLGAAAAVAVLALGAATVATGGFGTGDHDDTAAVTAEADSAAPGSDEGEASGSDQPMAEDSAGDGTFDHTGAALEDLDQRLTPAGHLALGSFDDIEGLAEAVADAMATSHYSDDRPEPDVDLESERQPTLPAPSASVPGPPDQGGPGPDPCEATIAALVAGPGGLLLAGEATVDGRTVRAIVLAGDPSPALVVLDPVADGCPELTRSPLP